MKLLTYHLKAHTISNKLVSKVFAQKKGGESYDSSNMCSNFGGFRCSQSDTISVRNLTKGWETCKIIIYLLLCYYEVFTTLFYHLVIYIYNM